MLEFFHFKFITFDCYGTLIDWETGILSALHPLLQKHSIDLSDADLLQLYGELEAQAEGGDYRSYRDVLRDVVRGIGQRLRFAASAAEQNALPNSVAGGVRFLTTRCASFIHGSSWPSSRTSMTISSPPAPDISELILMR